MFERFDPSKRESLERRRGLAYLLALGAYLSVGVYGVLQHHEKSVEVELEPEVQNFELDEEPAATRARYGDTPFGRGCLAARRLVEVGVRCVEVTLRGWDSHIDNHGVHARLVRALDPALASLVEDLRERDTLRHTAVLCVGEFGRTPRLNRFEGRDHWPHGFSVAIAGGGVRGGQVIGSTDPEGGREVKDPRTISDVYATVLTGLGIDPELELVTPAARPIRLSEGAVIGELLER